MTSIRSILPLLLVIGLSSALFASKIPRITSDELVKESELILIGTVLEVTPYEKVFDKVKIQITSFLKGETKTRNIIITLNVRGELKGWDPALKIGNVGVFFLRKSGNSYHSAHGGSISVFSKIHLDSGKKKKP